MGRLFILYGPSAAGKSELQRRLLEEGYVRIITATTRPPRPEEQDGVHYRFLDRDSFRKRAGVGGFAEWTEYNGELYGTLLSSIGEALAGSHDAVMILDLAGVTALKAAYPGKVSAVYIGADPDSLARRLSERGGDPAESAARLKKALEQELGEAYRAGADAVIWNSDGSGIDIAMEKLREALADLRGQGN
ncbi:hypothetical protein KIH86_25060 [Paenibacillus sp. HN-1]|uniref:guanylate kinase n=1 Tax=Paenibacillus TaxID=44249 RepID=UPI001CA7FDCB|nr:MULTISPECIES: hypothetical protein [Paenibacillus]MBY9077430.1 hypothetical protein [Paenibacillus sp. CGMCC 1.18879]MBY9087461.1 hypothetical protein [Paenibacillus sinensis]